jgi:hypothetical protein
MAINVGNASAAKLWAATTEHHLITVKNTGSNAITLGRSSGVASGVGMALAAAGTQQVHLAPGEELYGICASGQTSTADVI